MANEAESEWRGLRTPGTPSFTNQGLLIASAATIAPTNYIHVVSGSAQITLITLPYVGFSGTIAFQPTGAFTGATGGTPTATDKAVGLAFTAVVGKTLFMTYVPSAGLWYPSYTA